MIYTILPVLAFLAIFLLVSLLEARARRARLQALRKLRQSLGERRRRRLDDMHEHIREMKDTLGELHAHFRAEVAKQEQEQAR
jgi:hypothetical protein